MNASKADKERVEVIKNDTMGAVSKQLKKAKKAESWQLKVKVKGNIRLRYQYQDTDGGNTRSRGRYRARIGIIGKSGDNFEAGVGLVSGGSNPRATNDTFSDTFETKGAQMDYAYLRYKTGGLEAIGGKFKRHKYLYQTTDLMWMDVNPEGFATKYTMKMPMVVLTVAGNFASMKMVLTIFPLDPQMILFVLWTDWSEV